jgi:hypothetical protein
LRGIEVGDNFEKHRSGVLDAERKRIKTRKDINIKAGQIVSKNQILILLLKNSRGETPLKKFY